jgi:hypothetical protein
MVPDSRIKRSGRYFSGDTHFYEDLFAGRDVALDTAVSLLKAR